MDKKEAKTRTNYLRSSLVVGCTSKHRYVQFVACGTQISTSVHILRGRSPECASIRQKMLYASSKDVLKKRLIGMDNEMQACDHGDLAWTNVLDKLHRSEVTSHILEAFAYFWFQFRKFMLFVENMTVKDVEPFIFLSGEEICE